jgi:hypothetical protein
MSSVAVPGPAATTSTQRVSGQSPSSSESRSVSSNRTDVQNAVQRRMPPPPETAHMLGLVWKLWKLRGPAGILAAAVATGLLTGLVTTHVVLAAWTYRDASRRDLSDPGRWALWVLVGGVVAFAPYVALQRASDWSRDSRALGAARRARDRVEGADESDQQAIEAGEDSEESPSADADEDREGLTVETAPATGERGRSLKRTAASYGLKAVRRGSRWAVGRARRRLAD